MCASVLIDVCVFVVHLERCTHNACVCMCIQHVLATCTHTHQYLPSSHTACEALKTVMPILDKNPRCPSPGLLPPPFEMPLHACVRVRVCVCVRACMRACARALVRAYACARLCVRVFKGLRGGGMEGIRRLGTQLLGLPAQSLKGNPTLTGDTS